MPKAITNVFARGDGLPAGTPDWITADLVRHTLAVWQPRYSIRLTIADAIELICNVGRLIGVLAGNREPLPKSGPLLSHANDLATTN